MRLIYSMAFVMAIMPMGQPALGAAPAAVVGNIAVSAQIACAESNCDASNGYDETSLAAVRPALSVQVPDVLALLGLGLVGLSVVARRRSNG